MCQTCKRVVLIHELRKLAGSEKLLDRSNNRANVDQRLRRNRFDVLRGHAFADHTFHTRQTGAHLVLNQFTNRADTAVTKVVDVVECYADVGLFATANTWHGFLASVQADDVADGCHDVVNGQNRFSQSLVDTQLAVDLVATHLGQIVTPGVEVEVA